MRYQKQLSRIATKFERLRAADSGFAIGQAGEHQYELNEPASDEAVTRLEEKHRVSLPPDYRCFVTKFANGGAGPACGLFTINEAFAPHLVPHLPFPRLWVLADTGEGILAQGQRLAGFGPPDRVVPVRR